MRGPGRGHLKIFFGYAAGVGKTYSMLDAARTDQQAGRDVAVGYIEPHARPDTMALLEGLTYLPPLDIRYKKIHLKEFDLDGALMCHADLILVDEMAHTNAEACRHKKRWQDILELLDAGIDVYTTINVQHLESLHDIVASITHVRVNERVPDRIFDEADKIELVDTPPEELLARMEAGKIYQGERACRALNNFFTMENLTALREIALRRTADQVNRSVMRQRQAGGREYYTGEHVLTGISPAPSCEKVIRTAARMAFAFQARMTAVVIVRPGTGEEQEKFLRSVEANLTLAKQFGAQTVTLYGEDVAAQIADYARQNGVSKIVIGRTVRQTGIRGLRNRKNLVDKLTALAPEQDVYVIPDVRAKAQKKRRMSFAAWKVTDRRRMGAELLAGCGALILAALFGQQIERMGLGESRLIMACMLVCSLTISSLAVRLKNQARLSREESGKLQMLIAFNRELKLAEGPEAVLRVCGEHAMRLLGRTTAVYAAEGGQPALKEICLKDKSDGEARAGLLTRREQAVAAWVMKNSHKAGRTTDTLPEVSGCYFPIKRDGAVYGVVGIWMDDDTLRTDEQNLLRVLLDETAVTLKAFGSCGHL